LRAQNDNKSAEQPFLRPPLSRFRNMEKIWLIVQREYLTRVRKKSFIVMSILGPLLIAAFYGVVIWSALSTGEEKHVQVIDDSGYFEGKFESGERMAFTYTNLGIGQMHVLLDTYDAILYIPAFSLDRPEGFKLFAARGISAAMERSIRQTLEQEIEALRLKRAGIDQQLLDAIETRVVIHTHVEDGEGGIRSSNTTAASAIGFAGGFIIYLFIFIYGVQVMRGVIEEKTSRIVEVIISSVKPFQLMMGKILGLAGVGLTQLGIWAVLGGGISLLVNTLAGRSLLARMSEGQQPWQGQSAELPQLDKAFDALSTVDLPLMLGAFLFYFLFGYLMYAALFGAVGAAVDSETDTQQFMLPVTLPLMLSIALMGHVLADPYSDLAVFLSLFPLTSPVLMMVRLPFLGASWELALSMLLLAGSFVGTTWLAGRIYRVGILMYGKRTTYRELAKWLFYKQ
jgi:ABC-2 type transport system permease protein